MAILSQNIRFAVFFAALAAAVAAGAGEPAVMAQLRRNYGGAAAVSASFELSIYWEVREREEKKAGELLIAPGDRFKVTLGKEAFVCDGKTFWQYSERNRQVAVRGLADIDRATLPSNMLSSFLSGRSFEVKKRADGAAELVWSGEAGAGDGYTAITAVVDEKGGIIKTLRLTDGNGNIHTYTFKKTVFDKPPKDDVFRFTPPRGTEVVDMREGNAPK